MDRYWASNVDLPARLAQAAQCSGTGLVHVGTRWSIGERGEGPNSLYGATKALGDLLVLAPPLSPGKAQTGWAKVIRIRDLIGPCDPRPNIIRALNTAWEGDDVALMTPGLQLIDPLDVRDVADCLISVAEAPDSSSSITEIGLRPLSVRALVDEWVQATGRDVKVKWGALPLRGTELFEISPVHPATPFFRPRPRHITLRETLEAAPVAPMSVVR